MNDNFPQISKHFAAIEQRNLAPWQRIRAIDALSPDGTVSIALAAYARGALADNYRSNIIPRGTVA